MKRTVQMASAGIPSAKNRGKRSLFKGFRVSRNRRMPSTLGDVLIVTKVRRPRFAKNRHTRAEVRHHIECNRKKRRRQ